ncbi:GMC oxidoreductase [Pseudomonas sp. N040]|uniref:GMC oxidoreductase n=1 Tax=Pseudomonas sp. N040 TaxID=2785325 RepID=UPI0018A26161|nr:GMC oxidoreductase [Pseudomonas sp. N040]MBF7730407.1 GMC family oxidoreductase [Pseudomonas sp. N040]MBW7014049.1 FAD-binding protein [Pseudomonas sp. N040]
MSDESIDVLVIGSGFGGAVAANRLALAGKRVLLLERGPWRDSLPVRALGISRRAPFPYGRKALTHFLHSLHGQRCSLRLNKNGFYEIGSLAGLYTLAAASVGGGSLAYGGLVEPPRNTAMWHDRHPQLQAEAVERYYAKVISDLGGAPISRAQPLPQTVWEHFPTNDPRCQPADPQPLLASLIPPTAALAGTLAPQPPGSLPREYCNFRGDSFLGSPGGAKASVDFIYLAPVLGKGLSVRDLCEVTHLAPARDGHGGYSVSYKDLAAGTTHSVRAPSVVLAAGTLNTLKLLFAGAQAEAGLAPMPALGRGFFANGDMLGAWVNRAARLPSFDSPPVQGALTLAGYEDYVIGIGGLPGFETWPLPGFVKRFLAKVFFVYAMGADSTRASVTWVKGRLRSDYDYRQEPIYARLRQAFGIISEVSGHKAYPLRKPLSPHMGGGARLGANASEGVIDHCGEVYGNPGLYVVDGAALPAAPGGPPSVTIAAWAHHVADGIARRGC